MPHQTSQCFLPLGDRIRCSCAARITGPTAQNYKSQTIWLMGQQTTLICPLTPFNSSRFASVGSTWTGLDCNPGNVAVKSVTAVSNYRETAIASYIGRCSGLLASIPPSECENSWCHSWQKVTKPWAEAQKMRASIGGVCLSVDPTRRCPINEILLNNSQAYLCPEPKQYDCRGVLHIIHLPQQLLQLCLRPVTKNLTASVILNALLKNDRPTGRQWYRPFDRIETGSS